MFWRGYKIYKTIAFKSRLFVVLCNDIQWYTADHKRWCMLIYGGYRVFQLQTRSQFLEDKYYFDHNCCKLNYLSDIFSHCWRFPFSQAGKDDFLCYNGRQDLRIDTKARRMEKLNVIFHQLVTISSVAGKTFILLMKVWRGDANLLYLLPSGWRWDQDFLKLFGKLLALASTYLCKTAWSAMSVMSDKTQE